MLLYVGGRGGRDGAGDFVGDGAREEAREEATMALARALRSRDGETRRKGRVPGLVAGRSRDERGLVP